MNYWVSYPFFRYVTVKVLEQTPYSTEHAQSQTSIYRLPMDCQDIVSASRSRPDPPPHPGREPHEEVTPITVTRSSEEILLVSC